ncbi:MAG: hypothetical protein WDO15_28540 [Bacteroidota bacterium]
MKPDYSCAKTIEDVRAIKQAFWDQIHKELAEGKWRPITREEMDRRVAEIKEKARKRKEDQQRKEDGDQQTTSDNAA